MKRAFAILSITLITSTSFASNLEVTRSLLANKDIMAKATAVAIKEANASEFFGIELFSNEKEYEATLLFMPIKKTFTSVFRYGITVSGKTDGQNVLSANGFYGSGE